MVHSQATSLAAYKLASAKVAFTGIIRVEST
jgi:hypothetical protein